jgi:hypothetical protein
MNNRLEKINHSKIQHGKQNGRIYLMKLTPGTLANNTNIYGNLGSMNIWLKPCRDEIFF